MLVINLFSECLCMTYVLKSVSVKSVICQIKDPMSLLCFDVRYLTTSLRVNKYFNENM